MTKHQKQESKARTTCPFCLYGCELAIVSSINNYVRNVEYLQEARVNQGRLCPRGNAASIIVSDKKRLSYPIFQNKEISWTQALERITKTIKNLDKNEIAITFDKNLTEEEIDSISGFANQLGVENFASTYLEPEFYFSYILEDCSTATLEDIEKAKVFILIGDVFAQTPVISKPILNARYADRNNRIFVIDSIQTRTAGFADKFLLCRPGTEPLLVLAMSSLLSGKVKGLEIEPVAEISKVSATAIEEVTKAFSNINPGIVIAAMNFGRNENPYLFSLAGQVLAVKANGEKKFLGTGEARSSFGKEGFGIIHNKIKEGKIKAVLNFGDTFPYSYPQLTTDLSKLDGLIATVLFRPSNKFAGLVLPSASNLEKTGTINTHWGEAKITKALEPVSGSKTVKEIIESLNQALVIARKSGPKYEAKPVGVREVYEQAREFVDIKQKQSAVKEGKMLLLGEKPAIGFLNLFDNENVIKVNPTDCVKLKLKENEPVKVATENYETELLVKQTNQVPQGLALVGTNRIENRNLFPMVIDNVTNNVIFPPTEVKLWQK
jgi:anaerobic selenocysteine-containing dehydrogenase